MTLAYVEACTVFKLSGHAQPCRRHTTQQQLSHTWEGIYRDFWLRVTHRWCSQYSLWLFCGGHAVCRVSEDVGWKLGNGVQFAKEQTRTGICSYRKYASTQPFSCSRVSLFWLTCFPGCATVAVQLDPTASGSIGHHHTKPLFSKALALCCTPSCIGY